MSRPAGFHAMQAVACQIKQSGAIRHKASYHYDFLSVSDL